MIIAIASYKGGVGKSITAIHLAAYLQTKGSTVIIDGDLNRSVLDWSERGNAPFKVIDENDADQIEGFEHVVIDTPARPSDTDLEALAESSDLLVLPTAVDAFSIIALVKTVDSLTNLPRNRYRVLLTIVPPPPSRDGERAREALEGAGLHLFENSIRRLVAFQKSSLEGIPVYAVKDPRAAQAWEDYEAVGKEILP